MYASKKTARQKRAVCFYFSWPIRMSVANPPLLPFGSVPLLSFLPFLFSAFRFSVPFLLAFSHPILHELMVKLPRLSAPIDLVSYPTATPVTLRRSASHALQLRRFRKPIHLGPSDEALLPVSMLVLHSFESGSTSS
jgi:hypothetical protein